MKKHVVLFLCALLLPACVSFGANYTSADFTVTTDLDPNYAKLILKIANDFSNIIRQENSFDYSSKPVCVYYSKTQADTQKLLDDSGYSIKVEYGYFIPEVSAIYTHQFMNDGQLCGWDALFQGICQNIISVSFPDCPPWFSEGLSCFLGEQRAMVKDKLSPPSPNPWREQILRDKTEKGTRPSIKRFFLTSASDRWNNWDIGPHFARAFFYWLYETGKLTAYLQSVRTDGYELPAFEKVLEKPCEKANMELRKFIKKNCYAGAYLKDGIDANDLALKERAFLDALELKPGYSAALLELAELSCKEKNYAKCRSYLAQVISNPVYADYRQAQELMGDTYYNEKNYGMAMTHYMAAWAYSDYYEYRYKTAYKIANCYNNSGGLEKATEWYETFLNCNWENENMKTQVEYARKFTGVQSMTASNANVEKPEPNKPQTNDSAQFCKVKLETNLGDIVILLEPKAAPVTVKNFLRYIEEGFFDGTIFHRVIANFMIQGGGFASDMQQKQTHEPIVNEASNGLKNDRGTIAMARTNDPNSATAQFFINLKDNSFLNYAGQNNPGYAVFGKIVGGMAVVDKIAVTPTTTKNMMADVPVTPVVIKSAKVVTDK